MTARDEALGRVAAAAQMGATAQAVLDHPALRAAFERLEADYLTAITGSDPADTAGREQAYFRHRALAELRADLETVAAGGRIAAFNNRRATA